MKSGKLNWDDLKNIIDKNRGAYREEVLVSNGIGEDCAILNLNRNNIVISTDPITGAGSNLGKLAVNINCNDIASSGGEAIGIMVTILAPTTSKLEEIEEIMKDISNECKKLNVAIIGGHTEVTDAVNKIVVSCTVIGKANSIITTKGAEVGDDIIVTKYLALEGCSILAHDKENELKNILSKEEINEAKNFNQYLSVVEEGKACGKIGVTSMHDITEGGILGALWEMAEASNVGFEIYEELLPIKNTTIKICKYFNIDILRFISSGSMLIISHNSNDIIKNLKNIGIKATVIGKITEEKNGTLIKSSGEEISVNPPERDELFNI